MSEELRAERRALTKAIAKHKAAMRRHETNSRIYRNRGSQEAMWAIEARMELVHAEERRRRLVEKLKSLQTS